MRRERPGLEREPLAAERLTQALVQRLASPGERSRALTLRWHESIAALLALTTLLAASLMQSAARSYNPFIYFRF